MRGEPTREIDNGKTLMKLSDLGTVLSFFGIFRCG
jgi:hypothetical protein